VDGIEADRRVVEEVDELVLLVPDHLFHLVPSSDVLEAPEAVSGTAGQRMYRHIEPAARFVRFADRQRGDRMPARRGMGHQTLEFLRRAIARLEPSRDRL